MIQLAEKLAHHFKYYPDSEAFTDHYFSHPDYPSLYAVTDTLDFFGIANVAAKVSADQFNELPDQFLALYNTKEGEQYVFVTQKDKSTITFIDEANKIHKVAGSQFIANWKEIIVAIDENEQPVEKKMQTVSGQWIPVLAVLVLLLAFNQYAAGFSVVSLLYGILSFSGLGLSILLIRDGFGISNEIAAKICGVTQSDPGGCKSVLSSKGAVIYKNYTLSDLCFVFFTTLSLLSIMPANDFLYFIAVGIFSVPIIILSIYYQKVTVKKWCALCLGVSVILAAIGTTALLSNTRFLFDEMLNSTLYFGGLLLLTACVWVVVKVFLSGYFELKKTDREHKRFKRSIHTFNALLGAAKEIDATALDKLFKIEIGDKNAQTELGLFLSPSCGHCDIAFKDALSVFEKNRDILKLAVYYNVNIDNEHNEYGPIAEIIVEHYRKNGDPTELLKEWHINKPGLETFLNKYGIPVSEETRQILLSQFNWCSQHEFNYSPVKIFNKKIMPDQYSINDTRYFIGEFRA
jgi:disulfide bond formation protein DsbB